MQRLRRATAALCALTERTAQGTSPSMGLSAGSVIFAVDYSLPDALSRLGLVPVSDFPGYYFLKLRISDVAPLMPFLLMLALLVVRPRGLLGIRE